MSALVVLLALFWLLIVVTAVWERRERARLEAFHTCSPRCTCRGSIEGRSPR